MTSLRSVKVGTYTIFEALSQETSRMCMSVITEKEEEGRRGGGGRKKKKIIILLLLLCSILIIGSISVWVF